MRHPIEDHQVPTWQVHDRAHGFELLDVWRFPIRIAADIPLETFLDFRTHLLSNFTKRRSLTGSLFALRSWLGQVFGWDGDRDASEGGMPFEPVYRLAEEELLEIENATVHAFMHVGRVELESPGERDFSAEWSPQMGVYVKPKGFLGRAYMTAIAPFRHWIVYPALMRAAQKEWPAYLAKRS